MKQLQLFILMLCCLVLGHQTAWAQDDPNTIVFQETFDQTGGTGGRDGKFSGSGIANSAIKYDNEGWADAVKCGGASQCVKFGTSDANGVLTTPAISLGGVSYALLTFSAAGWADNKASVINTLTITANSGYELSGDNVITEVEKMVWNDYTVLIKVNTSDDLQLTFTGKRGFLDDVVVRTITTVPAPTLPDDFTFFPNTTETTASKHITLTPVSYTTAYYTTDGSTPSKTNGTEALLPTSVPIHGTTTVKAIAYVGDMQSEVVTKTYTQGNTVDGISAFCDLDDDTEARIFLADDATHETRVLYYDESRHQLFLRENAKALCVDFGSTATFSPTPQYNQHVAGWIVGKKTTDNGMPKLVATENTSTAFLAIADRVTEGQTEPNDIAASELSDHAADWVTIAEQRVGNDIAVVDRFGTGAYDEALVDVSGIVIPNSGIAPITQNSIPGVVYVIDEDQAFTSPTTDIDNATVRLKRSLSKDYWNTFVVPFDITSFDGEIREYTSLDGKTMQFTKTDQMVAGIPYLVKPNEDIVDPVYSDVTLSKAHATFVNKGGDYYFRGTYSPFDLSTDKQHMFLTTDGKLAYPQDLDHRQLKGMRAYIEMLNGTPAPSVAIEGDATGISEVRSMTEDGKNDIYDLQGRKVQNPGKGLYIVNGKKIIIQ